MLVIRLFRTGRKNQPVYKIVVTEKTNPPAAGRFVEEVGFFDPLTKERRLKPERIKEWLSKGAQPSDTVYNMLVKEGVLEGKKIPVHKKSKKAQPEAQAAPAPEVLAAEPAVVQEEAPAQQPVPEPTPEQVQEAAEPAPQPSLEATTGEAEEPKEQAPQPLDKS